MPIFCCLFTLFYIRVEWRGEAVGDKLKIGVFWDTDITAQRNSQQGDRMLSQTTVTYTGT